MQSQYPLEAAPIVDFAAFESLRATLGRIVATSGGFDPVHPGHASLLLEARKLGDTLVAIVNGDAFLRRKKGKPFQDLRTRCQVVSFLRGVDFVLPFEIEGDMTVCEALRRLRPHVFANGGDRASPEDLPEWKVCQEQGIEMVFGVGASKQWSSSDFLKEWAAFSLASTPTQARAAVTPDLGHSTVTGRR
jgi:D-beta-D-heptose 7-phosphate kinase/D-beta-D-heptose 1-phosphate adenosyltransferase